MALLDERGYDVRERQLCPTELGVPSRRPRYYLVASRVGLMPPRAFIPPALHESGGQHQVKPWFEGKLDFAPVVPALEGTDLRLRGGSVGYVFDRKAAVLVYGLRLHVVTLLVFRPDGLAWPDGGARQIGPVRGHETSTRGFNAILWRQEGLGYALVSDVNAKELADVAARVAAETVREPGR